MFVRIAAEKALRGLDDSFRVKKSRSVRDDLREFRGWDILIFSYACGLLGVWCVLHFLLTPDSQDALTFEWTFTGVALLINHAKMQGGNCVKEAPRIRKMLLRTFLSHKRIRDRELRRFLEAEASAEMVREWLKYGSVKDLSVEVTVGGSDRDTGKRVLRILRKTGARVGSDNNVAVVGSKGNGVWSINVAVKSKLKGGKV